MAWTYLLIAAAFEIGFALSMKAADGFTRFWPSVITAVCVVGGIVFLTLALKHLPVSVGYPIWTGIGALGTVVFGLLLFGESISLLKAASALAIIGGIIGLRATAA